MSEKNEQGRVVKAGIGYTVGNYMLKGLSFLTVPIFSRLLSTSDYGIFNTYLAYQTIVFLLIGLALHASLKNAKYKYTEEFAKYNSNCILIICLNLILWIFLSNLVYPVYADAIGFSRLVVNFLLLDGFGTALIQFFNVYVGLDYRYTSFLKISVFNALTNLFLSVLLILTVFKEDGATGRIVGNAVPVILIAAVIVVYFWRKAAPVYNREFTRFGLTYSVPLIPHGISQVILSQFDRIMIKAIIGNAQAGIYSFAYNIFSIVNVTITSLENVWGPWFYERMEKKDYKSIRRYGTQYAFGMLIFSLMVMLGTPELIKILGTKEYEEAIYSAIPIVAGGYFMFLYTLPSYVEYYYAKTRYIAAGTGMAAAVNILLNYVFIRRFGYLAASYTTLATYLLYFVFHYIIAWRIQKGSLFDTGKIIGFIVAALTGCALSFLLLEAVLLRWLLLALTGIMGLLWFEKEFHIWDKVKKRFH